MAAPFIIADGTEYRIDPSFTVRRCKLYRTSGTARLQQRIKTRLIMTPLGQPLLSFTPYKDLLLSLRDAILPILGHHHMYSTHGIVHRDISLNNVRRRPASPPHGFLIGFDFAILRSRQQSSGANLITGTFNYMTINELWGLHTEYHNPIHDQESVNYVLLDICINYDGSGQRRQPPPGDANELEVGVTQRVGNRLKGPKVLTYGGVTDRFRNKGSRCGPEVGERGDAWGLGLRSEPRYSD
ncbi:hypothetical protein FN846DRAFT_983597 [Sphaerosporella brunnea]|uniref:Fungal-type protein kinase domain-containing protein n=1 Tax=Sphaerosporella brunnea TaxID=1250544 RepID=A0A5J5F9G1_9PEZI|nr:hypothetical protein FN846DRAFT_983597 [Sphaerosporella brunnea]